MISKTPAGSSRGNDLSTVQYTPPEGADVTDHTSPAPPKHTDKAENDGKKDDAGNK